MGQELIKENIRIGALIDRYHEDMTGLGSEVELLGRRLSIVHLQSENWVEGIIAAAVIKIDRTTINSKDLMFSLLEELTYYQKIAFCRKHRLINPALISKFEQINTIRNIFAHRRNGSYLGYALPKKQNETLNLCLEILKIIWGQGDPPYLGS